MRGSQHEDGQHSTPPADPRRRVWPLILLGLAVSGLLVGLMLGRLMAPGDVQLLAVQATNGLELYFDREPAVQAQHVEGAYALLIQAQGAAEQGTLSLAGGDVKW